jgi:hypothetical protein
MARRLAQAPLHFSNYRAAVVVVVRWRRVSYFAASMKRNVAEVTPNFGRQVAELLVISYWALKS